MQGGGTPENALARVCVRPLVELCHCVADDAAVHVGGLEELRVVSRIAVHLDAVRW